MRSVSWTLPSLRWSDGHRAERTGTYLKAFRPPILCSVRSLRAAPTTSGSPTIAYIPTRSGTLYLAVVLDVCNRRIIGWAMATHMQPAMGSAGDCHDSAMCESFFAVLACELLDRVTLRTPGDARTVAPVAG